MDPLSALNIAAAVAAFVELGGSIFKASREIRRSAKGQTRYEDDVLQTIGRLSALCKELEKHQNNAPTTSSVHEVVIRDLCMRSRLLGDDLRESLEAVSTKYGGRKWSTLRHAIRSVWSENKIKAKEAELVGLNQELHLHLTACLKDRQSEISKQLDSIVKIHRELEMRSLDEVQLFRESLIRTVQESNASIQNDIRDVSLLCHKLLRTKDDATRAIREQRYLKSLYFAELNTRHHNIKARHGSTFDWIFGASHADRSLWFSDWLLSSNGVYWITGKAGCGKSTLMKHICQSPLTYPSLKSWAGNRTLVMAKFFFWRPGSRIGKSLEGLLRALLFEIFRQCPHLIPTLDDFESDGIKDDLTVGYWTVESLMKVINNIGGDPQATLAYAFFIDGLDEYDGEPRDIARAIEALASLPNIKICVSSREWNAFSDAFGQKKDAVLILQEHTTKDIELYVNETFGNDPLFDNLQLEKLSYRLLVNEIVSKAQGVFLWVYLVVRDLTNSVSNGDTTQEMLERIRSIPSELEEYFQHMIKSIPNFYKKDACMIFAMALEAPTPLSVLTLANVLNADLKDTPQRSARDESKWMKRRLKVRCQDLMEVFETTTRESWATKMKVDFIHRTVYDYLSERAALGAILSHAGPTFNANKALCEALVTQLDKVGSPEKWKLSTEGLDHSALFLGHSIAYYAGQIEKVDGTCDYQLLEAARRKMRDQFLQHHGDSHFDWRYALLDGRGPLRNEETRDHEYFMIFAIRWGLCSYVSQRVKALNCEAPLTNIAGYSPLYLALLYPMDSLGDNETASAISFPMIELLLKLGADPNQQYGTSTIWALFLQNLFTARLTDRKNIFQIVFLLLFYGADPKIKPRRAWKIQTPNTQGFAPNLSPFLASGLKQLGYSADEIRCLDEVVQKEPLRNVPSKIWQKLQLILRSETLSKYLQLKRWIDMIGDEEPLTESMDEDWVVIDQASQDLTAQAGTETDPATQRT